ncbi:uncharacterized protein BO66DRAFT_443786 [Aspergillus aculeatinus CBS 121060]|uniref:Uncharacterized protein n=1 Tax=Aspergillus aculeatinus CBS 121060 TaxID=1448322 RepID=A0ACD1GTE5_9EURO|nr:hypothetical protein BO66DRAFT_443786 [Aspergillus aculeatinus CBS 121060]RAH64610.1 hypothetical protein BO66DRAFT_443786 [Aspergillus aculeatinus CBS 121060]
MTLWKSTLRVGSAPCSLTDSLTHWTLQSLLQPDHPAEASTSVLQELLGLLSACADEEGDIYRHHERGARHLGHMQFSVIQQYLRLQPRLYLLALLLRPDKNYRLLAFPDPARGAQEEDTFIVEDTLPRGTVRFWIPMEKESGRVWNASFERPDIPEASQTFGIPRLMMPSGHKDNRPVAKSYPSARIPQQDHSLLSFELLKMQWLFHRVLALSGAADFATWDENDADSDSENEVDLPISDEELGSFELVPSILGKGESQYTLEMPFRAKHACPFSWIFVRRPIKEKKCIEEMLDPCYMSLTVDQIMSQALNLSDELQTRELFRQALLSCQCPTGLRKPRLAVNDLCNNMDETIPMLVGDEQGIGDES